MVRITSLNHTGAEPCWSPDGRYIVYSDHQTYSIFVVDVNGPEKRYIGFGESPTWMPNSKQIIYRIGGKIFKADLGTNETEEIYAVTERSVDVDEFAISNDGKHIAFVESRHPNNSMDSSSLHIMNNDGGNVTNLISPRGLIQHVSWSSDDRKLAYGLLSNGIRIFDLRDKREDTLAENGRYPTWSPVSDTIAYTENDSDDRGIIVLYNTRTQRSSRIRLHKSLFEVHTMPYDWLIWSPNGKSIAFFRSIEGRHFFRSKPWVPSICVLQVSDGKIFTVFDDRPETFSKATWSPDSSKLAAILAGDHEFILHVADQFPKG